MSVGPLGPEDARAAANVLADAFVDDPGWRAVGPARRAARRRYIHRTCLGAVRVALRYGGPSWCVRRGGDVVAVLTGMGPDTWPPPQLALIGLQAPGPLLAGPSPLLRSLRGERVVERGHPREDHFFVWMLAASPAHQRSGHGGALMRAALATADASGVPAYLDTANPDNLPYYRSHGFEVEGEGRLPRETPIWFMKRPPPADTS